MRDEAWAAQSATLVEVQRVGGNLEKATREVLGWPRARLVYDQPHGYALQVDAVCPSVSDPQVVVSTTYTKPETRGHSNENKLHLKMGELALLKNAYPDLRTVLVIGGSGDDWLPYVLKAFQYFYDEVLFLWSQHHVDRLGAISHDPLTVALRNPDLWADLRSEWRKVKLVPVSSRIPTGLVRYEIADILRAQEPVVDHPSLIENEVARFCMQASYDHSRTRTEWENYRARQWERIEMSRSYFNPVEATVEISLRDARLRFEGGVGRDVKVPSVFHDLGMERTRVSEDFVLHSRRLKMPVYVQCKSSGGGRRQHGKNIQNRTKEQIARSLIYRCRLMDGQISLQPKRFHWVGVLDGNWAVTRRHPAKYVHMLQLAGYDNIFCASDLLTESFEVKRLDNPLTRYLTEELDCEPVR